MGAGWLTNHPFLLDLCFSLSCFERRIKLERAQEITWESCAARILIQEGLRVRTVNKLPGAPGAADPGTTF